MATDDEIQNAILAIYSRLGTIEGKLNLVARADREQIIAVLEQAVREKPLLGQIYLLLDGKRTQQEVFAELQRNGVSTSVPTVSRRMDDLVSEFGVADPVRGSGARILRKNRAADDILNLTRRVRRILTEAEVVNPEPPTRAKRKKRARGTR